MTLSSSAFVTDASGVAIQHLEYMAFGEVFVDQRRTGFGTPYKFNAKELDCESGYYYYEARYYDPRMARFLSVDPLAGDMPAWGSYTYTFNNPIRLVDPTGMRPEETDDWYRNNRTGYYTWYDGSGEREGFTHVGAEGSVLGEFEKYINDIHPGGIYNEGFTFEIASNDKGALLPIDGNYGGNFLDEFVHGTGPGVSVMLGDHPYTEVMKSHKDVAAAQSLIASGNTDVSGQITGYRSNFGLKGLLTSGTMAEQFIGSFSYDGFTNEAGTGLLNIISDSKSRTSLLYHLPFNNVERSHSSTKNWGTGNTYQYYIWESDK
jgi:RHS repeat-associated protein